MFQRSGGTTGERLRKTRSATLTQRNATIPDPFISRQHAEVAATEAYKRARPTGPDIKTVAPKPQRRKSQASGRSEGSHLEDARLGRRRSTLKRDSGIATQLTRVPQPQCMTMPACAPQEGETIVTRKRSVIPPSPVRVTGLSTQQHLASSIARRQCRNLSNVEKGSPVPRLPSSSRASYQQPTPRYTDKSYEEGLSVRYKQPQPYASRTSVLPSLSPAMPVREQQTDDDVVTMARDRYLQDFHQKKVRERKSLFFGTLQKLQKRSTTELQHARSLVCDSSVLPMNQAGDQPDVPVLAATDTDQTIVFSDDQGKLERKMRGFSGSMSGRFKKLLRKASRVPMALPAQHIEAKTLHHPVMDSPIGFAEAINDPFVMMSLETPTEERSPPTFAMNSLNGRTSTHGHSSGARSRVTSWTNSTVAETTSTRAGTEHAIAADENGRIRRTSSILTLRKKSSLFGRALQTRLRKPSRTDMRSSEESKNLFAALQERIHSPEHAQTSSAMESSAADVSQIIGTRSSLPSQMPRSTTVKYSTVRTVSPDHDEYKLQVMSPVVEASPEHPVQSSSSPEMTPTQRLSSHIRSTRSRRPSAIYAQAPSQEHITRRFQRAQNRWQGPLDAASPLNERHVSGKYVEDNPYELPSISRNQNHVAQHDTGGLPQHTRIADTKPNERQDLLSPSLYSRATDGASPREMSPETTGGTLITITSREVKRYDLSPPKQRAAHSERSEAVQGSREWRKWYSEELHALGDTPKAESLALQQGRPIITASNERSDFIDDHAKAARRPISERHTSDSPPATDKHNADKTRRPRASSRRSDFMNDRYPVIESSRNSSRQSQSRQSAGNSRKFSSTDSEGQRQTSSEDETTQKTDNHTEQAAPRHLHTRRSLAHVEDGKHSATSTSIKPAQSSNLESLSAAYSAARASSRAKSAFDLRANYRHSTASASRAVEVHLKPTTVPILEDNTIRNISAGPYGSQFSSILPSSAGVATSNKENTPAHDNSLPALSSSEWLAGPTGKKAMGSGGQGRFSSPALGRRNGTGGSPGQRLVTGWLEERVRGSRENSPAFV